MSTYLNKLSPCNTICTINSDVIQPKIDWCKYFDAIYCVHWLPYTDRKKHIDAELKRIGVLDSGIFEYKYTFPNEYDKIVGRNMPFALGISPNDPKRFARECNLEVAYYEVMKTAIYRGFTRILTIEDDCCFVADNKTIIETLDHLPYGWDFVHFDKALTSVENHRLSTTTSDQWIMHNYTGGYWGGCMMAFSVNALRVITSLQEKTLYAIDYMCENRDNVPEFEPLKRYSTVPILVMQYGHDKLYHQMLM